MKAIIIYGFAILFSLQIVQAQPNRVDDKGQRQGVWNIDDARSGTRVSMRFTNDVPSDTILYYRNGDLKFTYIKTKLDSNLYFINDGNTVCHSYFTLKNIFYCADDSASISKIKSYILFEVYPVYPGGNEAMRSYLIDKMMKGPKNTSGEVSVTFTVDKTGKISDAKIAQSTNAALNDYCIAIFKEMPRWQPGYQGGSIVTVPYTLPLRFK